MHDLLQELVLMVLTHVVDHHHRLLLYLVLNLYMGKLTYLLEKGPVVCDKLEVVLGGTCPNVRKNPKTLFFKVVALLFEEHLQEESLKLFIVH